MEQREQPDMSEWKRFGAFLRSLRERLNWTQEEAGLKAQLSSPYLSQLERGQRRPPSREILRRFAQAYAVDESLLLREAGYEGKPQSTIPPERIEWAFGTMCSDPAYVFGPKVRLKPFDLDTKALLVEVYDGCTGRNLFGESETGSAGEAVLPGKSGMAVTSTADAQFEQWLQQTMQGLRPSFARRLSAIVDAAQRWEQWEQQNPLPKPTPEPSDNTPIPTTLRKLKMHNSEPKT